MLTSDVYGQGPTLVLIHGSPGNARTWHVVGQSLADRFTIVAVNMPDYDKTGPPDEIDPGDSDRVADKVEGTIKSLPSPVALAAHSYGANIALRVAIRGNILLDRLVLFEPIAVNVLSLGGEHDLNHQTKLLLGSYVKKFRDGDPLAVKTMIDFWFGPGAFEEFPEAVRSFFIRWSPRNVADVEAIIRETFTKEGLAAVSCPVRVAYGTKSPNVTRTMAEIIANGVANGSTLSVSGADHNIVATHADNVAAVINEAVGD